MTKPTKGISQSMFHSPGGNQQAASGDNVFQYSTANADADIEKMSKEDVVELLNTIEKLIKPDSVENEDDRKTIIKYLSQTKSELDDKKPSKDILLGSLKKVSESLKEASKISESGKTLWQEISPFLGKIVAWITGTFI
ncbi:hypothetical protein QGP82_09020 [Leptothoe sp. LEGE 181152]|nr:hypothetical protein [Leptothoe sp. LEGE 181152]